MCRFVFLELLTIAQDLEAWEAEVGEHVGTDLGGDIGEGSIRRVVFIGVGSAK